MTTDTEHNIDISCVSIGGDHYYKISDSDFLRPFFMNVVSDGNHWMFVSSNGGLSIGRKNAEFALFPYYTDDKITESAEITGSKTIIRVHTPDALRVWEPFSIRSDGRYAVTRNLYKSIYGNKVMFEEINHDLQLTFRYAWNSSNQFGFVRKATLVNDGEHSVRLSLLDGIQNILPYGVGSDMQNHYSNLVDAYKRSELVGDTGLGIYALSAIIVDKAEPSEALKANIAWSSGLPDPLYLLSSMQLKSFRKGKAVHGETDVKGEKGAYLVHAELDLTGGSNKDWMIVADVNQNHAAVAAMSERIRTESDLHRQVERDVELGTKHLIGINAGSDGMQRTSDQKRDSRHFSNTLFNVMRGGVFDFNYQIEKWDLENYLEKANKTVFEKNREVICNLDEKFDLSVLKALAVKSDDAAFRRLCREYMPLKFSRRHGDPSRPWNRFSINMRNADGTKLLDYEGNWRDIFQNWEALAHAYPEFIESMIYKFLNASTFDGYNPYRVTKDGFDWETIEPDNPWSYIGYWGDHQVIYLLKFLEFMERHYPGKLESYFDTEDFVYANVPYKIKPHGDILQDPKNTIDFDQASDHDIRERRAVLGADAALIHGEDQSIYTVNFIEKILAIVLAKLSGFIPEGGIWMNTQRPEWNDANNALVGNGVSMVTLCYLRRFLHFFRGLLSDARTERFRVSNELIVAYKRMREVLENNKDLLQGAISDADRKLVLDGLGEAASDYRQHIYKQSFWGEKRTISRDGLVRFTDACLQFIDHSIRANKRADNLYHAYNLMAVENEEEVSISRLSEMLEGQVAVLSSGYLTAQESLEVLDALKQSALFRDDQYSYLLYPNKELPGFAAKNTIPQATVARSSLLMRLLEEGNVRIVERDIHGACHFNGDFTNANDLRDALTSLAKTKYAPLVEKDKQLVLQIFEEVFNHKAFTGRSGTFFGYEGLGSIYWHMVSKLLLAVQECCLKAVEQEESAEITGRLLEHYYEINEGIGVHKPPSLYGAFPTDAYSHTPAGRGAQQPGMTGQVKEDILCRIGELGVFVEAGKICFHPCLLRKTEFLEEAMQFDYVDVRQRREQITLESGSLGFTYCQVPVIYRLSEENRLEVVRNDQTSAEFEKLELDRSTSRQVFLRSGEIQRIIVDVDKSQLK
jgi:hypothetical protein